MQVSAHFEERACEVRDNGESASRVGGRADDLGERAFVIDAAGVANPPDDMVRLPERGDRSVAPVRRSGGGDDPALSVFAT